MLLTYQSALPLPPTPYCKETIDGTYFLTLLSLPKKDKLTALPDTQFPFLEYNLSLVMESIEVTLKS